MRTITVEEVQKLADNTKKLKERVHVLEVYSKKTKNGTKYRYVKFNCRKHTEIIKEQKLTLLRKGNVACEKCHSENFSEIKYKSKEHYQDKINNRWGKGRFLFIEHINSLRAYFYCINHKRKFDYAKCNINNDSFGCSDCSYENRAKIRSLPIDEIKQRGLTLFGEKYNVLGKITAGEHRGKLNILCKKHGVEFFQRVGKFTSGQHGCPECQKDNHKKNGKKNSYADFCKNGKIMHPEANYIYPAEQEYISEKKQNLLVYCPNCEKNFITSYEKHIRENHGCKCQKKPKSKGELFVKRVLLGLEINFEQNHPLDGLLSDEGNSLFFDFYLPDLKMAIEFHGQQHFKPVAAFNGKIGLKRTQNSDRKKLEFCLERGIEFIELRYDSGDNLNRKKIIVAIEKRSMENKNLRLPS